MQENEPRKMFNTVFGMVKRYTLTQIQMLSFATCLLMEHTLVRCFEMVRYPANLLIGKGEEDATERNITIFQVISCIHGLKSN